MIFSAGGRSALTRGSAFLTASTMSSVEACPFFRTLSKSDRAGRSRGPRWFEQHSRCEPAPRLSCRRSRRSTARIGRSFSADTAGAAVTRTRYSVSPTRAVPAGRIRFCSVQALRNINGRKVLGVQRIGIQIHHDLAHLAAPGQRNRSPLHRSQTRADEVQARDRRDPAQSSPARQTELQNRHAGSVVLQNVRRKNTGRQYAEDRLHDSGDLGDSQVRP